MLFLGIAVLLNQVRYCSDKDDTVALFLPRDFRYTRCRDFTSAVRGILLGAVVGTALKGLLEKSQKRPDGVV